MRVVFQAAVFLGAFLLFFVQPLIAKRLLPWFGGGPAVWSACLMFFQAALVPGYGYAHVARRLGTRGCCSRPTRNSSSARPGCRS